MSRPAASLAAATVALSGAFDGLATADWQRPVHGGGTLSGLAADLAGRLERLAGLAAPAADAGPAQPAAEQADRLDRTGCVRLLGLPGTATAPAGGAAEGQDLALPRLHAAATAAMTAVDAHAGDTPVTIDGHTAWLADAADATTFAVVIGHIDAAAALEVPALIPPAPGRLAAAICEDALVGLRPRAMGRMRLLKAATGRIAVEDDRFPLW